MVSKASSKVMVLGIQNKMLPGEPLGPAQESDLGSNCRDLEL